MFFPNSNTRCKHDIINVAFDTLIINMPRKCCTFYNGESCTSGYSKSTFTGHVFGFPSNPTEQEKWLQALPNVVTKVTKYIGICELHWPRDYEYKTVQNGTKKTIHPPSLFGNTALTFNRQTVSKKDRETRKRAVLPSERAESAKQTKELEEQHESESKNTLTCSLLESFANSIRFVALRRNLCSDFFLLEY